MTAINFPSSPSDGDTHTVGGVTYTYNNAETKWKTTINSNAFLPLTGGTVSGNIDLNGNIDVDGNVVLNGELHHSGDTDTNIAFDTDTILFDTAGSERFRVGSAGQLGIGGATYGTDGQVLTSTGASTAPAWEDLPAAGWTNHGQTTTTSGSAHTVTGISTNARMIVIAYSNISVNSTSTPQIRLLMGNGSISTSDYYWATRYGAQEQYTTADTSIRLTHTDFNNAGNSMSGVITLVAEQTYMVGTHSGQNAGSWSYRGNIRWAGGGSIDRIQIATASTFDAGHFVVYSL